WSRDRTWHGRAALAHALRRPVCLRPGSAPDCRSRPVYRRSGGPVHCVEARSRRGWPERGWSHLGRFQRIKRASGLVATTPLRSEFSHARSSANAPAPRTLSPPLVHPEVLKIAVRPPDTTTTPGIPGGDSVGRVAQSWGSGAVLEVAVPHES